MKCLRQPQFLTDKPVKITDVWEVRLPAALWSRVLRHSETRRCSYSAITRFCIFRLAGEINSATDKRIKIAREALKEAGRKDMKNHRHMVCLYGEDVKLLRLTAIQLEMCVSDLLRIALWLYLPLLAKDIHSKQHVSEDFFFWNSIKRWWAVPLTAINEFGLPEIRRFLFSGFPPEYWWPGRRGPAG